MSLVVTWVQICATAVSRSVLTLFIMYSRLTTIEWNSSFFFPSNFVHFSFITHSCFCANNITISRISSPSQDSNNSTALSSWYFISIIMSLSSVIVMFIPSELNVLPLYTTKPQKYHFVVSITFVTTFGSTCVILLLSIYHTIVHFSPSICLYVIHWL